jgi:chromosome partitioning protein
VVYRELFPKGLTLLDLQAIGDTAMSHVAARQELRDMLAGLQLPAWPKSIGAPDRQIAVETAAE